jgi:2-polyprenyl-3-methyl-5-hydroxy-6-metoxy-1,4-benzoquinol methylase
LCRLDDVESRTVIDVGCGDGFYALEAKRAGKWVHAIDIAAGMVDRVREHVDRADVADLEAFDPGRTYDVVICSGVLDFVPNPEIAFQRLCRLVSRDGRLVVQVPRAGWPGLAYRVEKALHGMRVNLFSRRWFENRARVLGLDLKSWRRPLPTNMVLLLEPLARAAGKRCDIVLQCPPPRTHAAARAANMHP